MSIANWINDRRAKNRAKLYNQGYDDARSGRPRRVAATSSDQPGPARLLRRPFARAAAAPAAARKA